MPAEKDKLLTGSVKKEHPFPPQITKFVESAAKGVEFGPVVKVCSDLSVDLLFLANKFHPAYCRRIFRRNNWYTFMGAPKGHLQ